MPQAPLPTRTFKTTLERPSCGRGCEEDTRGRGDGDNFCNIKFLGQRERSNPAHASGGTAAMSFARQRESRAEREQNDRRWKAI